MNDEQIKKIIEDNYDESKEDTFRSMARDFFSKEMRWVMINIWVWFFIFLVPLIFSIIQFFRIDSTREQIMYATIFTCCSLGIGFVKTFGWVMMQRPRISREIKRLELRIAKLVEKQTPKTLENTLEDDLKEVTMRSWIGDFYGKKMRFVMINVFLCYFVCLVPIIFSVFKFFRANQTKDLVMYATIFVCCNLWMGFVSVFGWVMMQRPSITRKIKRLELRIAELTETVKNK
jgi:uncharacterized membrane protein YciS (DUF1049 family)